ncbi:MAG: amidohydrolase family protein, partial [Planctomycetota bacterium]
MSTHHSDDRLLTDDLLLRDDAPERVLIRNGRVVSVTGVRVADVLIERGLVARVADRIDDAGRDAVVIDALGKHLLPGAIDLHVHFRDPLPSNPAEDLRSGSRAAAAGGVTGFADMPNTDPPTITPEALAAKKALAAEKCAIDYAFYPTLGSSQAEVLGRYDRHGIPGFKAYMGGTTAADAMSEDDLHVTFAAAAELDVPVTVHSEDDSVIAENLERYRDRLDDPAVHPLIRDNVCCVKATVRAIGLAREHG